MHYQKVNNIWRIFFQKESSLVYKDLESIKQALNKSCRILEHLGDTLDQLTQRIETFGSKRLSQIDQILRLKYSKYFADIKYNQTSKQEIFNGIGSFWKAIISNLDSSDGEYF